MGAFRADNDATGFKRDVHPFMKVKRNGISSFHSGELRLYIPSQHCHRADRAIYMEPEILLPAQIGDRIQVIHSPGIDGCCTSYHTDGTIALGAVLCDSLF